MAGKIRLRFTYEEKLAICFLAGIAGGTILANLMGNSIQEKAGYMESLYESAARLAGGRKKEYLLTVLWQRIPEMVFLWFLSMTVFSEKGFFLWAFYTGLSSSAVLAVMVCQKGVVGPVCYLSAIFPQYLFYIPAWLLAAEAGAGYKNRISIKAMAAAVLLTGAGIAAEVAWNPFFVQAAAGLG